MRSGWFARLLTALFLVTSCACMSQAAELPRVRHVFLLLLENQSYEYTFGASSTASYLGKTLTARGALLRQYYGIGHYSLDNYLALISGQAPNEETQMDCLVFSEFAPTAPGLDAEGQLHGSGCVYPALVRTLPDQLEAAGFTWKAYMEDMGKNPAREPATCAHVKVGARENTDGAQLGDQYANKHNPFVYFHSIIDAQARCDQHVVNLAHLPADLKDATRTPNYVFITPNLCHDGHDDPCVDGRRGGLHAVDQFLRKWVPLITGSAAFRDSGMLVITFDESGSLKGAGAAACCGERGLPGAKYRPGLTGPGGGRIGAVVLSPFVQGGTVSDKAYNHYALLRTVETLFGLPALGFAAAADLDGFGSDVFSAVESRPPAE